MKKSVTKKAKTIDRIIIAVLLVMAVGIAAFSFSVRERGDAGEAASEVSYRDYNGKKIGILTGTNLEQMSFEYFPDSEYLYFDGYPNMNAALENGMIDAFLGDEPALKSIHAARPGIDYIREAYDAIDALWFGIDEEKKVVDMSDLTGENGTIRVITTSTDEPFSYIKDGKHVGYDIDVAARFCRAAGYAMEIIDVDFQARIPALESGQGEFTTTMNVTPEREEAVLFSEPVSEGGVVVAVRAADLRDVNGEEREEDNRNFLQKIADSFEKTFIRENRWKLILRGVGRPHLQYIRPGDAGHADGGCPHDPLLCLPRKAGNEGRLGGGHRICAEPRRLWLRDHAVRHRQHRQGTDGGRTCPRLYGEAGVL